MARATLQTQRKNNLAVKRRNDEEERTRGHPRSAAGMAACSTARHRVRSQGCLETTIRAAPVQVESLVADPHDAWASSEALGIWSGQGIVIIAAVHAS